MNIYVAIQNTVAQFQGITIDHVNKQGTLWNIRISMGDREMEFEIDDRVGVACVLERKNFGSRFVSCFMRIFIDEIELLEDCDGMDTDEDPIAPVRD